ncbi:MAG: hypothetical protein WC457_00405 [Patescibacteria group bacterium]
MREGEHGFYPMGRRLHTFIPIVTSNPFWKNIFNTVKMTLGLSMELEGENPPHGKAYTERISFKNIDDVEIFCQTIHVVFISETKFIPETLAKSKRLMKIENTAVIGVTLFKLYGNNGKKSRPNDPVLVKMAGDILKALPGAGVGIL